MAKKYTLEELIEARREFRNQIRLLLLNKSEQAAYAHWIKNSESIGDLTATAIYHAEWKAWQASLAGA